MTQVELDLDQLSSVLQEIECFDERSFTFVPRSTSAPHPSEEPTYTKPLPVPPPRPPHSPSHTSESPPPTPQPVALEVSESVHKEEDVVEQQPTNTTQAPLADGPVNTTTSSPTPIPTPIPPASNPTTTNSPPPPSKMQSPSQPIATPERNNNSNTSTNSNNNTPGSNYGSYGSEQMSTSPQFVPYEYLRPLPYPSNSRFFKVYNNNNSHTYHLLVTPTFTPSLAHACTTRTPTQTPTRIHPRSHCGR